MWKYLLYLKDPICGITTLYCMNDSNFMEEGKKQEIREEWKVINIK